MRAEQQIETVVKRSAAEMPRLRPRIHPRIQSFLKDKDYIFDLVEKYGSPLNLVFPQNIHDNIEEFEAVYKTNSLRGRIYFSSKPCKSFSLYREASSANIGIDVSSSPSLRAVMECGWTADRIGATGPKSEDYIKASLAHDVLINVDNIHELQQIIALHAMMGLSKKARVTLRIADYGDSKISFLNESDTTFGIATHDIGSVLSLLANNRDRLAFLGFSWHSSVARDEQRAAAMENILQLTYTAKHKGLNPTQINIGGGFPIMYADSCQQWADYTMAIKQAVLQRIPPQIWNKSGLGFRMEKGVLAGGAMFMDHAPYDAGGEALEKRLDYRMRSFGNSRFADIVRDSLLSVCIEPGSAMLNQCGITLGRVEFVKKSAKGENLIGLCMNRSNLHADQYKILVEPIVMAKPGTEAGRQEIGDEGVYYMGNLCLAYDMIQYNKTYPDFLPQAGDIVAFMNTAPYRMDFTESETLMQPVAQKISIREDNGSWLSTPDADYRSNA